MSDLLLLSHMQHIIDYIPEIQIVLSLALMMAILMQQSDESLGGAFGGSDSFDTVKNTRRGAEKKLFQFTIWIAVLFVISSIIAFLYK